MLVSVQNVVMVREIFSVRPASKGQSSTEVEKIKDNKLERDCKLSIQRNYI